jgi:ribonuclease HI
MNTDRVSETVIKVEDQTAALSLHSNDESITANDEQFHDNEVLGNRASDDEFLDGESFTNESLHDISDDETSDDEPNDNIQARKASFKPQRTAKAMDVPPRVTPLELFAHSTREHPSRMIRRDNHEKEILIYISGQCVERNMKKGMTGRAGCVVIFETAAQGNRNPKSVRFSLEEHGPQGSRHDSDQRTAELRALVAALELGHWSSEGWEKVTIALSSKYVHRGITHNISLWELHGWLKDGNPKGGNLPTYDLWARAIALVNEQAYRGCEVQFWLIKPKEASIVAAAASEAARNARTPKAYKPVGEVGITWKAGR